MKGRDGGLEDICGVTLTRRGYCFVMDAEGEGEGKGDLEFSVLVHKSNRRKRIRSEVVKTETIFRMKHAHPEVPQILDSAHSWKFNSGIQEEGQDNKVIF